MLLCNKPTVKTVKASMTVEASLSVPVFFMVVFSLIYLFMILSEVNQNQIALSNAAGNYATYGTRLDTVNTLINDGVLIQWDEDSEIPKCFIKYKQKVPFVGSRILKFSVYQQMCISKYEGKSMRSTDTASQEYVFITDNGRVYHRNRNCTYIQPSVRRVYYEQIQTMRNRSGGRYKRCERCCRSGSHQEIVFVTDYGDRYHSTKHCSGLKRSIRRVRLSDIGSMPPCSRCGG